MSWRPTTTTLILSELVAGGPTANTSLIAVPVDGSDPTTLVDIDAGPLFAERPDGRAFAIAHGSGIAPWESGIARWIVPDDLREVVSATPVWSPDGADLYFGRIKPAVGGVLGQDLGIFRVRPNGGLDIVVAGQPTGQLPAVVSVPRMVTRDNVLVWGRAGDVRRRGRRRRRVARIAATSAHPALHEHRMPRPRRMERRERGHTAAPSGGCRSARGGPRSERNASGGRPPHGRVGARRHREWRADAHRRSRERAVAALARRWDHLPLGHTGPHNRTSNPNSNLFVVGIVKP